MTYPDQKRADPERPIHELLAGRFSPRVFAPDVPDAETLLRCFSAAAWAPSAGNGQPWRFVVGVRGDDVWPRILGVLNPSNQTWAEGAPVLGIAIAQALRNGTPLATGRYDLGQALAHLTFQAATEGLYVHQMAGLSTEDANRAFGVPEDYTACTAFVIGRLGDPDALPDDLAEKERAPRHRRPLAETVFGPAFGTPAGFVG